jgi:hypothetical protein
VKIQYTLTRDDYLQWCLFDNERSWARSRASRWYRPKVALLWLLFSAFSFVLSFVVLKVLFSYALDWIHDDNRIFIGIAVLITTVLCLGGAYFGSQVTAYDSAPYIRRKLLTLEHNGQLHVGNRCQICLSPQELILTSWRESDDKDAPQMYSFEFRFAWNEVEYIEEYHQHAFIIAKSQAAVFVPKAAFPTPIAFQQFVDTAKRFWHDFPTRTAFSASPLADNCNAALPEPPRDVIAPADNPLKSSMADRISLMKQISTGPPQPGRIGIIAAVVCALTIVALGFASGALTTMPLAEFYLLLAWYAAAGGLAFAAVLAPVILTIGFVRRTRVLRTVDARIVAQRTQATPYQQCNEAVQEMPHGNQAASPTSIERAK